MVECIDHVGIAVKNLDQATALYRDVLGFRLGGVHTLTERKVKVAFFFDDRESRIELLQPIASDSPISKFLETRGEGIHHIAMRVDDIETTLKNLKKDGVALLDETPKAGAGGAKIAFVHPKGTCGVLMELVERPKK